MATSAEYSMLVPRDAKLLAIHQQTSFLTTANTIGKPDFRLPKPKQSELTFQLALSALDDLLDWLLTEGDVGIHDATNTTQDRR